MKICIAGAGSIGGILAARLAHAGHEVCVVARGPHLEAIKKAGLRLTDKDGNELVHVHPPASDDPADFGPQDWIILAVKAPSLADLVSRLEPLLGADTPIVTCMNGIPWWFCVGVGGPLEGRRLTSIDPQGRLAASLAPERLVGCVIHGGGEVSAPGTIRHAAVGEFIIGEPAGGSSARVEALVAAIEGSGLAARVHDRIHDAYWHKLLGNLAMNPVGALTGATLEKMAENPLSRGLIAALMAEAMAVGDALGLDNGSTIEERIELGASLGAFKASMLQDMEKGRPLEIDAIIAVVSEMGGIAGIGTPAVDAVHALVDLKVQIRDAAPNTQ